MQILAQVYSNSIRQHVGLENGSLFLTTGLKWKWTVLSCASCVDCQVQLKVSSLVENLEEMHKFHLFFSHSKHPTLSDRVNNGRTPLMHLMHTTDSVFKSSTDISHNGFIPQQGDDAKVLKTIGKVLKIFSMALYKKCQPIQCMELIPINALQKS